MDYRKYYTPVGLADSIIEEIVDCHPEKVIDICCGSCNLLIAARKRWNNALLYGVDIVDVYNEKVHFTKSDGREFACKCEMKFDLIVANPPFGRIEDDKKYPELYDGIYGGRSSRLEVEMLFANIKLLKRDGVLMIILPSSVIEGDSFINLRKVLAHDYHINKVIHLPIDSFGHGRINTYAVEIINDKKISSPTYVGTLDKLIGHKIDYKSKDIRDIYNGLWVTEEEITNTKYDIKRGRISSCDFTESGIKVLHTSKVDYGDKWQPSIRYADVGETKLVYAERGDIVFARVGKSAGKWTRYNGRIKMPISDCLFRIKDPEGEIYSTIRGKKYDSPLKGVATRYITINDICKWINRFNNTSTNRN